MTTTAQHLTQGSLRLRPASPPSGQNPQAWKAMVGTKPVSARFALLPETKPKMSALGTSLVVQIILVAFVVTLPLLFPQQMIPKSMFMVTDLAGPPLDIPEPPKPKPPAPPKVAKVQPPPPPVEKPAPPKPDVVKFFAPPKMVAPKPKPRQVEAELPKVNDTFQPLNLKVENNQPVRPREPVKTGMMSGGSSATPTIDKPVPVEKVQTGGFGDPNGVPSKLNTGKSAVNIAQQGSFDLPTGPGYGNGTGGANGARGVVASAGFGSGVAVSDNTRASRGTVKQAGFGDADVAAPATVRARTAEPAARLTPAEILSKPTPLYTDEARKLRIEGEVLVEAVLGASGKVQVLRVVRGLGHGLDEEAVRRAGQIQFKPALRDGQPADSTVVIHIRFQLA